MMLFCESGRKQHTHFTGRHTDQPSYANKWGSVRIQYLSTLQSLPSSLSPLKSRILRYSPVGKMATSLQWENKGAQSVTPTGRRTEHLSRPLTSSVTWFVRIIIKQPNYKIVLRISFFKEMIAVIISY